MVKSPRRACPFGTVTRLSGPGDGRAWRSARSTTSGRLKSLRSTDAPPAGEGSSVAGLGLSGAWVICWTTKARTVSITPLTRRRAHGEACAAGAQTGRSPSATRTRLAVRMGHPLRWNREEAPEGEDAAHIHERHR